MLLFERFKRAGDYLTQIGKTMGGTSCGLDFS